MLLDLYGLVSFYESVKPICMKYEVDVIEDVRNRKFEDQTEEIFLRQYVYVVLNTGCFRYLPSAESQLSKQQYLAVPILSRTATTRRV